MSSSKGRGKGGNVAEATSSSKGRGKGENVAEATSSKVEQLNRGVAEMSLKPASDEGGWEVFSKKSKNKVPASQAWGGQQSGAWSNAGQGRGASGGNNRGGARQPAGRGNGRSQSLKNIGGTTEVRPPLEHGWNWNARACSNPSRGIAHAEIEDEVKDEQPEVESEEDDTDISDSDDELLSDDYDSDASQQSHETRKQNKWFKKFFQSLDGLSVQEINEPARQWHCPACQGGPGAIDWYKGLLPLTTHAKTKGSKRVKLHRELAELLDEELKRRGTSAVSAGESFGQWKGLAAEEKDYEIIWPPMVMIMNTKLEQDENDKWIGMGNQELLDYFSSYAAMRARHSYGPQGHRGMSVLIFEASAKGYLEAERLHKHFEEQGTDRDAWDRRPILFHPGGMRQLYGFLAKNKDLDMFNQHSPGKTRLKYDMRSHHEMVVKQIRQMSEDNQQLMWFKNAADKEKKHSKALEKSFEIVSEKLRKTMEENRIVRQRTKLQHEQTKEEMDYQESFFKDQIKIIHENTDAKEEEFERIQQQARGKMQQSLHRDEEKAKFNELQKKNMEEFEAESDKLSKLHKEKMAAMTKQYWEEKVALEKTFDVNLTSLMDKYKPHGLGAAAHE